MQAPTHVLAGVLIEKVYSRINHKWLRFVLIAITALFLHSIMDRIALLTYHPPEPHFRSIFWLSYHILVVIGFILSLYYFWKAYWIGIFFSILPDFDWVIIHGKEIFGIQGGFYSQPWMHKSIHFFVDRIPPFSLLQHLPDLREMPTAALTEIFIACILLYIIFNAPFLWSEENVEEMDMEEAD